MSMEGVIVGEATTDSAPPSAPGSPSSRIKFLVSHGGKILPRPADNHLKYVGGETRVISVPKDIAFLELMKKLTYQLDGEMILKYQLVLEDIDTLVSVKSDEDLKHMFEENDRYERAGSPRLRAFLFPKTPIIVDSSSSTELPQASDQRYIDAINGFVRPLKTITKRRPNLNVNLGSQGFGFYSQSACTSPRSPDSCTTETMYHETILQNNHRNDKMRIQKVKSSPSLCSLDSHQQSSPSMNPHFHHYRQQPLNHSNLYIKPPIDPRGGGAPERMFSISRYQTDQVPQYYSPSPSSARYSRGLSGGYPKSTHYDEYGPYTNRPGSVPMTPVPMSPQHE